MSSEIIDRNEQTERLDADYRGAFDEWVVQVSRLQEVTRLSPGDSATHGVIAREAADRVAAAENDYRRMRDRLADNMSHKTASCE
jgi:hypothetical protein